MARTWSRREKLALAAAGAATALFLLGRWVFVPFFHFATGADERIEEGVAILRAYQEVAAREEGLRQEDRHLDEVLGEYRTFYLPADTPPLAGAALEARLKDLAEKAGLNIVSGKILGPQKREPFVEIPVQIVATGSIEGFRNFIVLAESSEIYIGIREMNIRALGARQLQRPGSRRRTEGADIQATMTVAGLIPS